MDPLYGNGVELKNKIDKKQKIDLKETQFYVFYGILKTTQ